MGDINYEKAEKEIEKAVQNTTVKDLVEGKTVKSSRAMDYYGVQEEEARPQPEDRVERLMSEAAAKEEEKAEQAKIEKKVIPPKTEGEPAQAPTEEVTADEEEEENEDVEDEFTILTKISFEDTMKRARKQSARTPKRPPIKSKPVTPSEKFREPASPLLILRKHILWLKRLHMDDRYEQLGTTKEEVFSLRRAERLTNKELQRVIELNQRAEELKKEILKKHGKESLEDIVEKEKKKHKSKRFHTRETWIPL